MPPSWQQNTPSPCRIPSTLYPLYSLPCLYRYTTYSPCAGRDVGFCVELMRGGVDVLFGKNDTPQVLTRGGSVEVGVQVWYCCCWQRGGVLSAADFMFELKQAELLRLLGVSASEVRSSSATTTTKFSSGLLFVAYEVGGNMLLRGRVASMQLAATQMSRAEQDWSVWCEWAMGWKRAITSEVVCR